VICFFRLQVITCCWIHNFSNCSYNRIFWSDWFCSCSPSCWWI
jgi:hypothetical protein